MGPGNGSWDLERGCSVWIRGDKVRQATTHIVREDNGKGREQELEQQTLALNLVRYQLAREQFGR